MYFTQEDYRKIESWLQQRTVKDSELPVVTTINGSEKIPILQDNENKAIEFKELINQTAEKSILDFYDVSFNHNKYGTTVTEAARLIPEYIRKPGLVITFTDINNKWQIYQYQYNDLSAWNSLLYWINIKNDFKELIGIANGIAPLDNNGRIPSAYLPSYVDDVLEYSIKEIFPTVGESGKIYIALSTNTIYRWSGSTYVEIPTSLGLGLTSSTAYPGNEGARVSSMLYSHLSNYDNPHKVSKLQLGLQNVDNTSDLNKPISKATQQALDEKADKVSIPIKSGQQNGSLIATNSTVKGLGEYGIALSNSEAAGSYSFAHGNTSTANTMCTFTMGYNNTDELENSGSYGFNFNFGDSCNSKAFHSFVFGLESKVLGNYSFVFGEKSEAKAPYSHAEGYSNITNNIGEYSIGYYGKSHSEDSETFGLTGNTLFSIGNGLDGFIRHNAFEVRQDGTIYIADTTNIKSLPTSHYYNKATINLQDFITDLRTKILDLQTKYNNLLERIETLET